MNILAAFLLVCLSKPTAETEKIVTMERTSIETSNDNNSKIVVSSPHFTSESNESAERVVLRKAGFRTRQWWAARAFGGLQARVFAIAIVVALAAGMAAGILMAVAEHHQQRQQKASLAPLTTDSDGLEEQAPTAQLTVEANNETNAPGIETNDQKTNRQAVISRSRRHSEPETPEARSLKVINDAGRYLNSVTPGARKVDVIRYYRPGQRNGRRRADVEQEP